MASQLVEDARTLTNALTTAYETQLPSASAQVDQARKGLDCKPLDLSTALEGGKGLHVAFDRLEVMDAALRREEGEDSQARQQRDLVAEQLYQDMSAIGGAVTVTYGRAFADQIKVTGRTPRTLVQFTRYAEDFLQATSPMPPLPEPINAWGHFDLAAARESVQARVPVLRALAREVARENRETQHARSLRNSAHQAWYRELRLHIDLARTLLLAAGLDDLAARLLPTSRQIASVVPTEDPEAPESPQSPGGEGGDLT